MSTPVYMNPRAKRLTPVKQRHGVAGHDLLPRPAPLRHEPHAIVLRGLGTERGLGPAQPTFVARTEDNFVDAVKALLAEQGGAAQLADAMALLPTGADGHFKFYPPVQRVHQLVLVEACCAEPGFPRLDPRQIESAGMVIRRPTVNPKSPVPTWLAWQRRGEQPVGWVPLSHRPGHGVVAELDEPDAKRRPLHELTGNAYIDTQLKAMALRKSALPVAQTPPSERVIPLHPLPEALCAAIGRTLLLGYLPVATEEVVDSAETARPAPDVNDVQALQSHFMHYLQEGHAKPLPRAGERIDPSWLEAVVEAPDGTEGRWIQTLMQLHLEFDVTSPEPQAAALRQVFDGYKVAYLSEQAQDAASQLSAAWLRALCKVVNAWDSEQAKTLPRNVFSPSFKTAEVMALYDEWVHLGKPQFSGAAPIEISLEWQMWLASQSMGIDSLFGINRPESLLQNQDEWMALQRIRLFLSGVTLVPAGSFVRDAIDVLMGDVTPAKTVIQPNFWGDVSAELSNNFAAVAAAHVHQREAAMYSGEGKRMSEPDTPMAVRCFVRLKTPATCQPSLAWSAYSDYFTVAPWWETGYAKPRVIDMPDPFDRGVLRKLKPNIGFAMPGRLGNLMSPSNLKKLQNGDKPSTGGAAIDWICGFNIPIITICALIMLNVFLQLLNFVFWWLPFVKICLPIPRKK